MTQADSAIIPIPLSKHLPASTAERGRGAGIRSDPVGVRDIRARLPRQHRHSAGGVLPEYLLRAGAQRHPEPRHCHHHWLRRSDFRMDRCDAVHRPARPPDHPGVLHEAHQALRQSRRSGRAGDVSPAPDCARQSAGALREGLLLRGAARGQYAGRQRRRCGMP